MKGFLSVKQREELLQELKLERYARYSDRLKAVLLLDEGKSAQSIADYLFLSDKTIRNYKSSYEDGGIEGLIFEDYKGSDCKLTSIQVEELKKHLTKNLYRTTLEI